MTDAHDAKAREIADVPYIDLLDDERDELAKLIAAALRDCERQTLERAAQVAKQSVEEASHGCDPYFKIDADEIAARIRALAQETPGSPDKVAGEPREGIE